MDIVPIIAFVLLIAAYVLQAIEIHNLKKKLSQPKKVEVEVVQVTNSDLQPEVDLLEAEIVELEAQVKKLEEESLAFKDAEKLVKALDVIKMVFANKA